LSLWVGGIKFQAFNADNLSRWYAEEKSHFVKLLDPKSVEELYGHVNPQTRAELNRILSEDYAKYLSEKRREFLQRFSDDRKAEYRSGNTPGFNTKSKRIAEKFEQRTDSFVKQVAAMVIGHAKRKHCEEIAFDDSNGVMFPGVFPWFKMKSTLAHAAQMNGIKFVPVCDQVKKT
jgi:hypothetical protein